MASKPEEKKGKPSTLSIASSEDNANSTTDKQKPLRSQTGPVTSKVEPFRIESDTKSNIGSNKPPNKTSKEVITRSSLDQRIQKHKPPGPPSLTGGAAPVIFPPKPTKKKWYKHCYDRDEKTCCGMTCRNWLLIVAYSLLYMIFLSTFTIILLYASLEIMKSAVGFVDADKSDLISFADNGIGLTAAPSGENENHPLIWYRKSDPNHFKAYIDALERLIEKRSEGRVKRQAGIPELGPCGSPPFGYGDAPCILIRINKMRGWSAKPLEETSDLAMTAPKAVRYWMKTGANKLWLHCDGYYPWDREHIGEIKYYPDPPGFDASLFPLNMSSPSPLVAVQLSKFTLGMSLSIECKLWYTNGPSSVSFVLYVAPSERSSKRKSSNASIFDNK